MGQHLSNLSKYWSKSDTNNTESTNSTSPINETINPTVYEEMVSNSDENRLNTTNDSLPTESISLDDNIINATNDDTKLSHLNDTEVMPEYDMALTSESEDLAP